MDVEVIVLLVIISCVVAESNHTGPDKDKCPPDQEYQTCGSACPDSCDSSPDKVCTEQCVIGCFCKPPLVLDGQGKCIHPSKCPGKDSSCPPGEVYKSCGSACPPTCVSSPQRFCTLQCVSGCFCKPPLVRNINGCCINRAKCPKSGFILPLDS